MELEPTTLAYKLCGISTLIFIYSFFIDLIIAIPCLFLMLTFDNMTLTEKTQKVYDAFMTFVKWLFATILYSIVAGFVGIIFMVSMDVLSNVVKNNNLPLYVNTFGDYFLLLLFVLSCTFIGTLEYYGFVKKEKEEN